MRITVTPSISPKIIVICGPTGVGKTGFAINLAKHFKGEIVGADAMQVYRRMDVGTAKPTREEQAAAIHHMVDVVDPNEDFDAAGYAAMARQCLTQLVVDATLPIVVGGTGLYIKALLYGLSKEAPSDPTVRVELKSDLDRLGSVDMHQRLSRVDPESAQRIHPNDSYRILRALEVHTLTGRSITALHKEHGFDQPAFDALQIGLTLPRETLYARIDRRVDLMLDQGLLDEVRSLLKKGFSPDLKSMQALGYRHMVDFIHGRLEWDEAVRTLKRDHRRYAKRQMTWFGAVQGIHWMQPDQIDEAIESISNFIQPR